MSTVREISPRTETSSDTRRFRLIRGGARHADRVVAEPPPKQILLSPASSRWQDPLAEALGPSYRVVRESLDTPAAVVIDSRDDDLVRRVQEQRSATRIIVVHTGHPSEQPMAPAAIIDLGADTYLAPVSLPMLVAHVKALTRSWDSFPPRPAERVPQAAGQTA
jgi:hypothetical protein